VANKTIKILRITSLITLAIVMVQTLLDWGKEIIWSQRVEAAAIVFVVALFLTLINVYYEEYISNRFSWESEPKKRLIIGSLGSIVVTVLSYALARLAIFTLYYGFSFEQFLAQESRTEYLFFTIIAIVISLIIHSFYFYKASQENKVKEQKIIAGTASAKFDALKNQLDPHFLFNSLNVLTSLIEENPDQAQKFTTSLSKVYRYVLEQKNKDLVTVDEELKFARTYVRLLKMRFEDSIIVDIPEQCSDPEAKIIPLSLQLLLENAVKHNVVSESRPLHLTVKEEEGMLVVSNNLQEKQVVKKSSGVGLTNIQQRYRILTERQVHIHKTAAAFSVKLPMLTKQISTMKTQKIHLEDKRYEKAKEKVEAIKEFYGNLTSYCIVMPILIFINYKTTSFPWAIFPALGWGFGVVMHGLQAYDINPLYGKKWEERKMREFMDDDNF